ncbi:MAG: hypothetical protein AVDCRST_MAG77-5866, partial [uncultured Chloroflexi bacterium]
GGRRPGAACHRECWRWHSHQRRQRRQRRHLRGHSRHGGRQCV